MKLWDTPAKNLKIIIIIITIIIIIIIIIIIVIIIITFAEGREGFIIFFFDTEIKIFGGMKNEPLERVFRRFPRGGMAPIVRQLLSHTRGG